MLPYIPHDSKTDRRCSSSSLLRSPRRTMPPSLPIALHWPPSRIRDKSNRQQATPSSLYCPWLSGAISIVTDFTRSRRYGCFIQFFLWCMCSKGGLLGRITHRYVSNLEFPDPIRPSTPIRIGYVSKVYPWRIRVRYASSSKYPCNVGFHLIHCLLSSQVNLIYLRALRLGAAVTDMPDLKYPVHRCNPLIPPILLLLHGHQI
jgi:hypothetical protein